MFEKDVLDWTHDTMLMLPSTGVVMRPRECAPIIATISEGLKPNLPVKSATISGHPYLVDGSKLPSPTHELSSTRPVTKGSTRGVTFASSALLLVVKSSTTGSAAIVDASSMTSVAAST